MQAREELARLGVASGPPGGCGTGGEQGPEGAQWEQQPPGWQGHYQLAADDDDW